MIYNYNLIKASSMPEQFKQALLEILEYIEQSAPKGLLQVILFGSLARSNIHYKSDIDICLLFEDTIDLQSREIRIFKSMTRGATLLKEVDVIACTLSQLTSNSCTLYQEINRDKIILAI